MQHLIYAIAASLVTAVLVILVILLSGYGNTALDQPNHRSLHTTPVPRIGGIGIMAGVLVGWFLLNFPYFGVTTLALALAILSFLDDLYELGASGRFLGHLLAAIALIGFEIPDVPIYWQALIVLAMVWVTNLYNFMDGMDGLAGGMGMFGFATYAIAAWLMGMQQLAVMCMVIAAACSGFLSFNFHPARTFMGDVGSIPLGFLAAGFGLIGVNQNVWPWWLPLLAFSPFIVDATVTLVKRLLKKEKIWLAHRSHYYQRLVQMGWGHRKTALAEYFLMLAVSMTGLLVLGRPALTIVITMLSWLLVYGAIMLTIDRQWKGFCSLDFR